MILTLEQARAMRWPFRNPRQPMGLLLDQGIDHRARSAARQPRRLQSPLQSRLPLVAARDSATTKRTH